MTWLPLWTITHKNAAGMPDERRHRLTRRYQHRNYTVGGGWKPGRLPRLLAASGPYVLRTAPKGMTR